MLNVILVTSQVEMKKNVIDYWGKVDLCYKMAKKLTALCSSVLWKVELGSYEIRYLAEIFKHSIEDASFSFLLIVKM